MRTPTLGSSFLEFLIYLLKGQGKEESGREKELLLVECLIFQVARCFIYVA